MYQPLPYNGNSPYAGADETHPIDHIEPIEEREIQAVDVIRGFFLIFQGERKLAQKIDCLGLAAGVHGTLGLTMSDVAKKYGVSRSAITQQVDLYREYFGLPPSEFAHRRDDPAMLRQYNLIPAKNADKIVRNMAAYKLTWKLGAYLSDPRHKRQSRVFFRVWMLVLEPIVRAYFRFRAYEKAQARIQKHR